MSSGLPPIYRRAVAEMIRGILTQGKTVIFTVRGDSMAPMLKDGDQVRIVLSNPSKLQPGELVAYVDAGSQIIIHRVVRVEGTTLITKGDNRHHDDPPVPVERVLGKAELGV